MWHVTDLLNCMPWFALKMEMSDVATAKFKEKFEDKDRHHINIVLARWLWINGIEPLWRFVATCRHQLVVGTVAGRLVARVSSYLLREWVYAKKIIHIVGTQWIWICTCQFWSHKFEGALFAYVYQKRLISTKDSQALPFFGSSPEGNKKWAHCETRIQPTLK